MATVPDPAPRWSLIYSRPRGRVVVGTAGTRVAAEAWRDQLAGCWPGDRRVTGTNPDALVQLVAERVVVAWVVANYLEDRYEVVLDKLISLPAQSKLFMAQIELANRHLLSACRTLAKVRRAHLPDVLTLVQVAPPTVGSG